MTSKKVKQQSELRSQSRRSPLLILLLIWVLPAGIWGASSYYSTALEKNALEVGLPATVVVGERNHNFAQGVDVVAHIGSAAELRFSGEGVVTALHMSQGAAAQPGNVLFELDGSPKVGYSGLSPFYRELSMGMQGPDVVSLSGLLEEVGFLPKGTVTDYFSFEVFAALSNFQSEVGLKDNGILDPSSFVFIPADLGVLADMRLAVASPVPSDGVISVGTGIPLELRVVAPGEENAVAGLNGQLLLSSQAKTQELDRTVVTGPEAALIYEALDKWSQEGNIPPKLLEGNTALFTGLQVSQKETITSGVVPNTAVVANEDGGTCVLVVTREDPLVSKFQPVQITPISSEIGVTGVNQELIGERVVRAPNDQGEASAKKCPSS